MKICLQYAFAPLALLAGCGQDPTTADIETSDQTTVTDSATTGTAVPADNSISNGSATETGPETGAGTAGAADGQPDKSTSGSTAVPPQPADGQPTTSDQAGETPPR